MRSNPLSTKLCWVITASLLLTGTVVQATEPPPLTTITVEKAVYFLTSDGEYVQIQPGKYQLEPRADGFEVIPTDGQPPISLQGTLRTHDQDLAEPVAASVPGLPEGELSDKHILALLLPGGMTIEADGTYSGIRSRTVSPQEMISDPMKVYLDTPVHFQAPDGSDIVPPVGTYTVEAADQWIRLVPGERRDAILLEATKNTHEGGLEIPVALSLPGAAGEEADLHYVVLLLPDGNSLQALGTYSGLRPRGLFDFVGKAAQNAGRQVNKFGRNAGRTLQQTKRNLDRATRPIGQGINKAGQNVGRFAQQAALEAKKKAEEAARLAAQGALIAAKAVCKAGLTAAQITAQVQGKLLGPIKEKLAKALGADKAQKALRQAIDSIKQRNGEAIRRTIEATLILTDSKNSNTVKDLISPNKMCDRPGNTIQNTFQKMVGGPVRGALAVAQTGNDSQVRSRGSFASASIALGFNAAKGVGGEIGPRFAFDFVNKPHLFIDLASMLKTNVGVGGGVAIGIFPKKDPVDTGGWFLGAGIGFPCKVFYPKLPKEVGCNVDFFFDTPLQFDGSIFKPQWDLTSWKFFLDHFQGFAVGVGGGKSVSPVDIAIKVGGGIRVTKK
jgi:hypothetical protein